jgi:class 3 adenylate cyclase
MAFPLMPIESALEYTPRFLLERAFKYKSTMIGERKPVSVLFADVADFTTIAEKLDPEDVHEIMDGCFGILGREIHQAGGTINQYTGDGVLALFGVSTFTIPFRILDLNNSTNKYDESPIKAKQLKPHLAPQF